MNLAILEAAFTNPRDQRRVCQQLWRFDVGGTIMTVGTNGSVLAAFEGGEAPMFAHRQRAVRNPTPEVIRALTLVGASRPVPYERIHAWAGAFGLTPEELATLEEGERPTAVRWGVVGGVPLNRWWVACTLAGLATPDVPVGVVLPAHAHAPVQLHGAGWIAAIMPLIYIQDGSPVLSLDP